MSRSSEQVMVIYILNCASYHDLTANAECEGLVYTSGKDRREGDCKPVLKKCYRRSFGSAVRILLKDINRHKEEFKRIDGHQNEISILENS
ncbi:hypothetical protein AYI70_g7439 [Smittium culicis]|uniref:Uncharacterized protein n=1 Tax=Smittium culicis TaxID=133412 RepID=A0A1R1XKK3_9FUNG|nr:hypothetical protein AYI70_g7439 [Smittium culicis]